MVNGFKTPLIPLNDEERLEKLYSYKILDTPEEKPFQFVVSVASSVFEVPYALISLVDRDRVWLKANIGLGCTKEISRAASLCSRAMLQDDVTVVEDAKDITELACNPLVAGFKIRFYAAAPLITTDGFYLGVVCILDKQPRKFSQEDSRILKALASIAMEELEKRIRTEDAA